YKLALTEEEPTVQPYNQEAWAELPVSTIIDINPALELISGLHARWAFLLKSLDEKQWERCFIHPESGKKISLKLNTAIYAWHCEHHLAHITRLKERKNW
ncbi:MAG: DinB family protein, partial [Gillisia sp.]